MSDLEAGVAKALKYFSTSQSSDFDEARHAYFCEENERLDWETAPFINFTLCGYRDDNGERLLDIFMAESGGELSPAEEDELRRLASCRPSLFEVETVARGTGFSARDLLTKAKLHFGDVSASIEAMQGAVCFAWIRRRETDDEIHSASFHIPAPLREPIVKKWQELASEIRQLDPQSTQEVCLAETSWVVTDFLRAYMKSPQLPALCNTDGDPLIFCRSHFVVNDAAAVRARLQASSEFDGRQEEFVWLDAPDKSKPADGQTVLGNVSLSGNRLVLDTNSRQRAERGKKLLEVLLGQSIEYRADSVESIESAMKKRPPRDPSHPRKAAAESKNDLPLDVQAEILEKIFAKQLMGWLDEEIPLLGGKTPRATARTAAGRKKVARFIDDYERNINHTPGKYAATFARMRKELRLNRIVNDCGISYDAESAPDQAAWKKLDDCERLILIEEYHSSLPERPGLDSERHHAELHSIIENQLLDARLTELREALARLTKSGVSRHEAIHQLGEIVVAEIEAMDKEERSYDRGAVRVKLGAIGV